MATGRGLRRWTDGLARQALQAASGDCGPEERARAAEGAWLMTTDVRARGYKQGWADGQAGRRASRQPKSFVVARFWLVFQNLHKSVCM